MRRHRYQLRSCRPEDHPCLFVQAAYTDQRWWQALAGYFSPHVKVVTLDLRRPWQIGENRARGTWRVFRKTCGL